MNFFTIGSVNSYIKTMDMQSKWQKKKNSGDFKADGTATMSEWCQKKQTDIEQAYDIYESSKQNSDEKLSSIYIKIQQGSELTDDEAKYIKQKNPALYQKLKNDKLEKQAYEKSLKQCKTKEDVQRLKLQHINSSVAEIKSVQHNPNISDSNKLQIACAVERKISGINKITQKFIQSINYSKLPTDAETNKFNEELSQANENQINDICNNDNQENIISDNEISEPAKSNEDNELFPDDKKDISVTEAEFSEEAKKVKHSKVKNTYIQIMSDTEI